MARVAVVGAGYVGLTTSAGLAHLGHEVVCADVIPERVENLSNGKIPIVEDGLEELVNEGLEGGRLSFVLGAGTAAQDAEFVFLCVPTPQGTDGSADMSYIETAVRDIGPVLVPESIVINKSTVPVGSTLVVERALGRSDVFVVSNPEFLREGSAVHDFLRPDRIVIGAKDQAAAIRVTELFEAIRAPFVVTDPPTAETIKYASNAFLATKVSFINAVANLCEAVGANMHEVVLAMGYDKRIGFEFLRPGPGWGGSCFLPEETVLVTDPEGSVRHLGFEELFRELDIAGADGWEVLSWAPGQLGPEMRPVSAFTARPYSGPITRIRTKMGRRLSVTADHPMVVGNGVDAEPSGVKTAGALTTQDWLPVAIGSALEKQSPIASLPILAGVDCYSHRIPDAIWTAPDEHKRALLRGLWDGDGSWSLVNGGPSVVLEYGTVSGLLADGILRLLGELGIIARVRVGRTAKSTVDTYWLTIAGAGQIEDCLWLFPEDEAEVLRASIAGQRKRILPTGYRPLLKNGAWVRVAAVHHHRYAGPVYSLEVPGTHTVVTTGGLVAHNCFPKDTRALVRIAEDAGYDFQLLKGVIAVNEEQYERVVAKVVRAAGGSVEGARLAVWGLTFKARTDDLRESPALAIIDRLVKMGAAIRAFDPTAVGRDLPGMTIVDDAYDACDDALVLVILTEWDQFRWLDLGTVRTRMASPRIVDARNLLDPSAARRAGFRYEGIGLA